MKMFKLASATIVAIYIAASCESNSAYEQQNGAKVISLEPVIGNEQVVNLSEIASTVDYIPLQTSAESLIGEVMHLTLENDVIYIPDYRASKLSRFSISGEYLGSVGKRGRAFGEYTMLTGFSFDYDYESGIETIFDLEKLIEYNPNGSINEITIKGASDKNFELNFIKKHGNIYIAAISKFGTYKHDLIFLDSIGNLMGDFPEGYNKGEYTEPVVGTMKDGGQVFTYSIGGSFSFPYRYKELLMITSGTRDTIFGFESNDTVPQIKYIIDAGKYMNEKDEYGGEAIKLVPTFTRESNKHLFLTFNFTKYKPALNEGPLVRVLFNKETSQTKALVNKLVNDIDGGPSFWPLHISRDGKMVSIISAIDFMDAAKESKSQKMKQIAATLTEESNPVIMVVK